MEADVIESVTEVTTAVMSPEVLELLQHIDTGVTIQTHIMYLFLALVGAYCLYMVYTFVFRRFW